MIADHVKIRGCIIVAGRIVWQDDFIDAVEVSPANGLIVDITELHRSHLLARYRVCRDVDREGRTGVREIKHGLCRGRTTHAVHFICKICVVPRIQRSALDAAIVIGCEPDRVYRRAKSLEDKP